MKEGGIVKHRQPHPVDPYHLRQALRHHRTNHVQVIQLQKNVFMTVAILSSQVNKKKS